MTQDFDQGAGTTHSSRPSAVAADTPAAPMGVGGIITIGSILTVAGILLLFVIFAFGLVSLQYCFSAWDRRRQGDQASPSWRRRRGGGMAGGGGSTRRTRGVDPEVLRSLPVTVYRGEGSKKEAVECAVCLAELEDGEEARFLPSCGHGFHAECVDMWLASHSTCPLCRLTVAKPDVPLPPVRPEPANYAANLPATVLLGLSDHGAVTTVGPSTSNGTTADLVIEIPELAVPSMTPRDAAAKSPSLARLRSFRRLWSFGRQGTGPSSSCSCGDAGEEADVEQGMSVTIGVAVTEAPQPSEVEPGVTRGAAA